MPLSLSLWFTLLRSIIFVPNSLRLGLFLITQKNIKATKVISALLLIQTQSMQNARTTNEKNLGLAVNFHL